MQINGNGQPGIRQDIADILVHQAEVKGALAERSARDNRHYKNVTVMLSLLSILMTISIFALGVFMAHHG